MSRKDILKTRICELFEIDYPIVLAGMGVVSGPTLVAAVSNAGGLGVLGAAGLSAGQAREWIRKTRRLTDKPFGLDLILPAELSTSNSPNIMEGLIPAENIAFVEKMINELELSRVEYDNYWSNITTEVAREVVQICIEEGVALFASGLGNPGWVVPEAHESGMLVLGCVGNTKNAQRLKESGVDIIVAQGYDGGGHTGRVGTMSLVPQVVDAVSPVPVIAAGGIVDGRGLAAALSLGAEGVWIGTGFIASKEANVDANGLNHYTAFWDTVWKQALINAVDDSTTISKIMTGKRARYLKNSLIDVWDKSGVSYLPMPLQGSLVCDLFARIAHSNLDEYVCPFSGQGAGLIKQIRSAEEIVTQIVEDAVDIFTKNRRINKIR